MLDKWDLVVIVTVTSTISVLTHHQIFSKNGFCGVGESANDKWGAAASSPATCDAKLKKNNGASLQAGVSKGDSVSAN
ncbi:hypothetical protein CEXT_264951 [Caerostris extrusa]|uniref:Uncharacterized protein n=1 Tax=Caerostris extrusa TaxID=172846 RepID=A0AAV4WUI7_CAEEX|nr:hypothetical protein CEXT_264951 [Caerostris extrusa]